MQITRINPVTYSYSRPKIQKPAFLGYKDIKSDEDKILFDKILRLHINHNSTLATSCKKEAVNVNGNKLTLVSYDNGFYVLKSGIGDIKATMSLGIQESKTKGCLSDFYSDNNGAVQIKGLYSKGNGAGKEMIRQAVKKSFELGYEGRVIIFACNIFEKAGSPIPFYNKLGFRAFYPEEQSRIDKEIQRYEKTGKDIDIEGVFMYLDPEKIKEYLN